MTVVVTISDEFIDGYIRSVFQTLTDKFTDDMCSSVNHAITDGIKSVSIFQAGKVFFSAQIPSVKPLANDFFCVSDWYSDGMWNYRQKESRQTYSVGEDVGK